MKDEIRKVMVIGHKNPDTDSICSAICYANLRNRIRERNLQSGLEDDGRVYEPCRAGVINKETEFVLHRFGFELPRLCLDVRAQVSDLDIRGELGIPSGTSLRNAWRKMIEQDISTLPVVHGNGHLEGVITVSDIAMANMDSLEADILSKAHVPVRNILETIEGELINGDAEGFIDRGRLIIGAGSPEAMEDIVEEGDIVIVGDRYEAQLCAIELGASVVIVCLANKIAKTIRKLAEENHCMLIATHYDTYTVSRLINQSIPVGNHMQTKVMCFTPATSLDEVREAMSRVRYDYFPVVDDEDIVHGLVSKRNLINLKRKELVLVDHNEKSQCVDGFEEAEILGIIDHHRIGDMETSGPILFRNQPVGCTATIIYHMFREHGIGIEPPIAGLLCCAILSDTLKFRSPTCTKKDRDAAADLAVIAGVDLDQLASDMFDAGEDMTGKTPDGVFHNDCKTLRHNGMRLAIAQGTFNSVASLEKAEQMIAGYIDEVPEREGLDMAFYLATGIQDQSSDVLYAGRGADALLREAFRTETEGGKVHLPGVMSRKKQFVPALLDALENDL
ncbi:MAG: putative manganese-dependent inorganic diphosphatase [Lachnospiraceae bacterium]|nr:putative manganese-dependent inorganic diphosphatase [Lachnospiraceae bacterium]